MSLNFKDIKEGDVLFWNNVAHGNLIVQCEIKNLKSLRFKLIKQLSVIKKNLCTYSDRWNYIEEQFDNYIGMDMKNLKNFNNKISNILYGANK